MTKNKMSFYSITLCACETFPHDIFNCAHDYFCAYVGVVFFVERSNISILPAFKKQENMEYTIILSER